MNGRDSVPITLATLYSLLSAILNVSEMSVENNIFESKKNQNKPPQNPTKPTKTTDPSVIESFTI